MINVYWKSLNLGGGCEIIIRLYVVHLKKMKRKYNLELLFCISIYISGVSLAV